MRILLILPNGHIHLLNIGPFKRSMREAPLTMPVLAALAPKELDITFELIDESIDRVPLDSTADLVAISVITGTAVRAYQLADHFRKRGIPVVLGGVHVSLLPDEAQLHADSIIIGTAEKSWPELLRDFSAKRLQKRYQDQCKKSSQWFHMPYPRYDLLRRSGYMVPDTIMATRGCRQACSFCTIPSLGVGFAKRPIGEVIRDITTVPSKYIVFNDVSLVDDPEYAAELFKAMLPIKKRWGGLATTKLFNHPELIRLMAESGCTYLLFGFESFYDGSLEEINKHFNQKKDYSQLIKQLHDYKISVQGCFIFGFDQDDITVFEETVDMVNELSIDIPRFSIITPYPGTVLYKTLTAENRILSHNWNDYDTMHVVFEPKQMTVDELYNGFKWAYQKTFTLPNIVRRTYGWRFSNVINLLGNINYRRFSGTLTHHSRYSRPHTSSVLKLTDEVR